MDIVRSESDLEDGEIRDDVLEEISDCSLSDIIHEELSDDSNLDSLRNEALKSLQVDEPANEEEKCRLEALKSLLENTGFLNENDESLQGIEGLTEEEKFRVEAVKSLLRNINFLSTKKTPMVIPNRTKKRRKRRKIKKSDPPKRSKTQENHAEDVKPNLPYLEETTSLLSGLSEDVRKINECIETKKIVTNTDTDLVSKENINKNDSINESPVVVSSARSWYPKTEFTLLDRPFRRNIVAKRKKCDVVRKVNLPTNNSCNQKPANESIGNHTKKTESVIDLSEPRVAEIPIIPNELPKQQPLNNTTEVNVPVKEPTVSDQPIKSESVNVKIIPVPNKPIRTLCDSQDTKKVKKTIHQIIKPNVLIRSPKSKPIIAKTSTPCSFRKFHPTQPVPNGKTFPLPRKANRYKLNNVPTSKYTIKKNALKIDKTKLKLNNAVKSRYSINRTNQYTKVNSKEFIIPLNDDDRDDSSKEEELSSEPVMITNSSETQPNISSSVNNHGEIHLPKIKEEPQDVPKELPIDEFVSNESPSTTTADPLPFIKEEPLPEPEPQPEPAFVPFDVSTLSIVDVSSLQCDTSFHPSEDLPTPSNVKLEAKSELDVLLEAEENLIEIRSKLLSSLTELDTSIKTNSQEKVKLFDMVKKLNQLKIIVTKFEEKIKTQKMKLAMSNSFTQSLYEGVMLRSKTCSKMKDLCSMAGKKIVGPLYKPPEDFEIQVEEKQKTLDFSKYVQKAAEKK